MVYFVSSFYLLFYPLGAVIYKRQDKSCIDHFSLFWNHLKFKLRSAWSLTKTQRVQNSSWNQQLTSFIKRKKLVIKIINQNTLIVPFSHGVGGRCEAHLWRRSHGHRQSSVHRRCLHSHDVPPRQGHGKNFRSIKRPKYKHWDVSVKRLVS